MIQRGHSPILVYEGEEIVGCRLGKAYLPSFHGTISLVHPRYQKQRLGSLMIQLHAEYLKRLGFRTYYSRAVTDAGHALCLRNGFVPLPKHRHMNYSLDLSEVLPWNRSGTVPAEPG
jgi:GNAT superfamily N-acetyltransferase